MSAAGCGPALERPLGASLGDGAPEELFVAYVSTRVRGQPCRLGGRGFRPRSAPSGSLVGRFRPSGAKPLAPCAWLRAVVNTCFRRIRGLDPLLGIVRVWAGLRLRIFAHYGA